MQTTIVVKVSGGLVQGIVTNDPTAKILVLDYDIDNDDRGFPEYPEPDGTSEEAAGWFEEPLVDESYTNTLVQIAEQV